MKKNIPTNLIKELEWSITKIVSRVKSEARLAGLKVVPNWKDKVSSAALDTSVDVPLAGDNHNLYCFSASQTLKLLHVVQQLYPNKQIVSSGSFLYPETGYMGWHTNSDAPCTRLYITYKDGDGESFFRYLNSDNEVITDYDDDGITIREFNIPELPEQLWHCVGSECDRYSFGFKIKG